MTVVLKLLGHTLYNHPGKAKHRNVLYIKHEDETM
jgi:hypothetical protein